MEYPALYVCEFSCTAIPAFVVYLVVGGIDRRGHRRGDIPSLMLAIIFAVYLFALFHLTGAGTLHDALRYGVDLYLHQTNWLPLLGFFGDIEGHLLNVLLFVPLGFLVPMLSGRCPGILRIILLAAVVSATIEASQLLNSRVTDIDDLLMNEIGTLIGYWLICCIRPRGNGRSCEGHGIDLSVAMIVAAFCGKFFLYDELGLAKTLFGF